MDERINLGYTCDEEALWKKFKKAFTDTYMDIAEGVKVDKELQELHIKDGNINTYITTFKKLLKLASYAKTEQGTLKLFKLGLPYGLNLHIINNSFTIPTNLKDYIEATCQQQLRYSVFQNRSHQPNPGPKTEISLVLLMLETWAEYH